MRTTSRRTFLRGAGGTLALPWLESLTAVGQTAAIRPPLRMCIYYVPIGVVRRGFFPGEQHAGLPAFNGDRSAIVETRTPVGSHPLTLLHTLEPLESVRDRITLITGLDRTFQNGTDVHAQCASCFLSSAAPFSVPTSAWPLDRTLDHVIADQVGDATPFRTLEFSCNSHRASAKTDLTPRGKGV